MNEIIIEGIRCFHQLQAVPIKPITILVGENSSGKSTFLALMRLAWDVAAGITEIDFNEEPFLLGTYNQIASYRQGRSGRAKSFSIGGRFSTNLLHTGDAPFSVPADVKILGTFENKDAQPILRDWSLETDALQIRINFNEGEDYPTVTVKTSSGEAKIRNRGLFDPKMPVRQLLSYLGLFLIEARKGIGILVEGQIPETEREKIRRLSFELSTLEPRPYAFAPIRTHPQRTYDPIKDSPRPEGSHVPMILAKMSASDSTAWGRMRTSLAHFGKASGLFDEVDVHRMGEKESGPFQIRVKISGPLFNLVDVGYGVSQVLPIIVDCLREAPESTFLLQQPEVHLHPKAQAELGSFLASLAKEQNKRFLIETHSDYLVDRIRMDVRDRKNISATDVSILYFERQNGSVKIHPVFLDEFGNIKNPPPEYRRFFLEEKTRFLVG